DEGYAVTTRFLNYLMGLDPHVVGKINAKLSNAWSEGFFAHILGRSVQQLASHDQTSQN
ncbi:hypothetical protein SELMODRAFT_100832, partial [Selaginella moellendorffii]